MFGFSFVNQMSNIKIDPESFLVLEKGVYVIGFFYPVVPHGTARVRTQVSAAHSREDLEFAVNAFAETNEELR